MTNEVETLEGEAITENKPMRPDQVLKNQLESRKGEFLKVLPSHISYEKFQRTVMTAVIASPDLMTADRGSLLLSCVKAATDGLLPDGREAALVIFNTKGKDGSGADVWMKKVQYLPMYLGILKKVRQSGEILSIVTHPVYKRDKFEYVLGDDERIVHEPYIGSEDRGEVVAAYCITKLKDGQIIREVMTRADIEKVRKTSKSGALNDKEITYAEHKGKKVGDPKGIWAQWYEEMARKTVFRRASKWLPQRIEIVERIFENDDSMDTLDLVAESAPEERIAIEDKTAETAAETMPDLKAEIEKKKEAEKAPVSEKPVVVKEKAKEHDYSKGDPEPDDENVFPPDRKPKTLI